MFSEDMANYAANRTIRKLEENGRIGRTESQVFSWDGVLDGKQVFPIDDSQFSVRISDATPSSEKIERLTFASFDEKGGVSPLFEYDKTKFSIVFDEENEGAYFIFVNSTIGEPVTCCGVLAEDAYEDGELVMPHGIYVVYNKDGNFGFGVHKIDLTETVTPISEKYLPGPVIIDLDELGVMDAIKSLVATNGGFKTINIAPEKLWNRVSGASNIVCKFLMEEKRADGNNFNISLTGAYHVPATRIDHYAFKGVNSISFNCVFFNSIVRVTIGIVAGGVGFEVDADNNITSYPTQSDVYLDLYPLTPAPGNL